MSDATRPLGPPLGAEDLLAHAAWLRRLARSLVADDSAADDVVQETFAVAIDRPPRERGALRAWLAKVARHVAWKSHRGDARRTARERSAPRRSAESAADETVARLETQRALLDAVQELEEPYRVVVMRRFYDGKAPREIAQELGVKPEVVWQRLSRAIAMLRARLDARRGGRDAWAGVFLVWLDGGRSVPWGGATVGTGAAVMGTKAVVAAGALAAGVAVWALWSAGTVPTCSSFSSSSTAPATPSAENDEQVGTVPARRRRAAEPVATDASPSAIAPRGRVRGRVLDAVTGEPVAAAHVYVVRKSRGGGFVWSADTAGDGTFSAEVDETPTYAPTIPWSQLTAELTLAVTAPGYLYLTVNSQSRPGFETTGEDFGDLKLERGRTIRGRVVTADGRPVARADVFVPLSAQLPSYGSPLTDMKRSTTADDTGVFQISEALQPTEDANVYRLMAVAREGVAFTMLPIRAGRDAIDGVVLVVHAGVATVTVTGPDGRAVAGADVAAIPTFQPFGRPSAEDRARLRVCADATLAAPFTRKTATDGRATFDTLPLDGATASYAFGAMAEGFAATWSEEQTIGAGASGDFAIRLVVAQPLVAGLHVVDVDGRPVGGVHVTIVGGAAKPGTTDADGAIVLGRSKGAPGDTLALVELTADGFAPRRHVTVKWTIDDGGALQVERMERPVGLTGRVVDQDDRPVAGARVALARDRAVVWADGQASAADGTFSVPEATPGEWSLLVMPSEGGDFVHPPDTKVEGGARDVVVRVQRLAPAQANAVVDVVDAATRAPVDAQDAVLFDLRPLRGADVPLPKPKIDAGRVSVGPLRPGEYALWLRVADRPNQLVRLHIDEGSTDVKVTCRVNGGVAISGRVRVPEGYEGELPRVIWQPHEARWIPGSGNWPVTSDGLITPAADGSFRVEGVTPAVYEVSAARRGWYAQPVIVDATPGDVTADVELRRGVVLRLRGEGPIEAVCVWIEGSLDGGPWSVIDQASFEKGRFDDTETMAPGTLRWRAVFRKSFMSHDVEDAALPQSGEVLLEAGKDVELVIPVVPKR